MFFSLPVLIIIGTLIGTIRGNHPETIGCQDFDPECALIKEVSDAGHVRLPDSVIIYRDRLKSGP